LVAPLHGIGFYSYSLLEKTIVASLPSECNETFTCFREGMVREKPLVNLDDPVLVLRFAAAPARALAKT